MIVIAKTECGEGVYHTFYLSHNASRLSDVFCVAQRSKKCAEGQARTRA